MAQFSIQFLDFSALLVIAKGYTYTMHAGTSCSANTMQIALGFIGETEVYHCFYIGDIETTSHQVSSQEIVHIATLEFFN